ncbi:MAG: hypothetical protein AMXMBFR56_37460 [Polyangiaceae bacterium]
MTPKRPISSFVAALCSATLAHAEPKIALDRFEPAPAGDALLSIPDFDAKGAKKLALAGVLAYASEPLVLSIERSDGSSSRTVLVDHQLLAHLGASLTLGHWLVLDAALPTVLSQGGDPGSAGSLTIDSPSGSDVGDLRLGARLALLPQHGFSPGAAFATTLWFPTATGGYAGTGSTRAGAGVVIGTDYRRFFWRTQLGARQRQADDVYAGVFGSEAFGAFALGYRLGSAQLGAELIGATSMDAGAGWFGGNTTHLEALGSARYFLGPVAAFVGAGPGLTRGAGTPAFRVILGLNASFELASQARASSAGAGTPGPGAGTPLESPIQPSGAVADRDRDGVPDAADQCPDVPGEPDAERPGCPRDQDRDGIADAVDRCPTEAGVASADPNRHGCPPDRDEDGIPDALDACADEKGPKTDDPKTNGCPPTVRVVGQQIVIIDQVNFATGSDVLAPESSKVLEQVAAVLTEHPEIARLAVDGHTDDVGQDKANLALSRRRAIAVVRWLVGRGVDERRLEARGFGPRRPIADPKTAEGRAKNRRVEFQILKKTELGERGWKDGPVDE